MFQFEPNYKWSLVAFGLVAGSILLSWIAGIIIGGFKMGSLERRVQHRLTREEYPLFWERMCQRLWQLGFQANSENMYVQSGSQYGDLASHTHAKTKKEFRVGVMDSGDAVVLELTLRYLDPIVGDTGESAYRDGVLDFLAGKTERMEVVPNRSFGAVCSVVEGIVACGALFYLHSRGCTPLWPTIVTVTSAGFIIGALAALAIRRKPMELKGLGLAVAGMAFNAAAALGSFVLK